MVHACSAPIRGAHRMDQNPTHFCMKQSVSETHSWSRSFQEGRLLTFPARRADSRMTPQIFLLMTGGKAHICSLFPVPPLTCQSPDIFSAFPVQAVQNISLYRGSRCAFRALAFSPGRLVRILLGKQCHSDGEEGVLMEFLISEILQEGWKCFGLGLGILGSMEI